MKNEVAVTNLHLISSMFIFLANLQLLWGLGYDYYKDPVLIALYCCISSKCSKHSMEIYLFLTYCPFYRTLSPIRAAAQKQKNENLKLMFFPQYQAPCQILSKWVEKHKFGNFFEKKSFENSPKIHVDPKMFCTVSSDPGLQKYFWCSASL